MSKVSNATVVARPREDADRLIKRFVRKCKKYGFLDEVRRRRYFEKKSDKKRREKADAEYRRKRDERKAEAAQNKTNRRK